MIIEHQRVEIEEYDNCIAPIEKENFNFESAEVTECNILVDESFTECESLDMKKPAEYLQNSNVGETKPDDYQICRYCGLGYPNSYLNAHDPENHIIMNGKRQCELRYRCGPCQKPFTRKHNLVVHLRQHNNYRPFLCEICSHGFRNASDLRRHRLVHGDKNYECPMCQRRFKRSTDVKSHMRTHTGLRPYKCRLCEKVYSSHSMMKKHTLLNHPQ